MQWCDNKLLIHHRIETFKSLLKIQSNRVVHKGSQLFGLMAPYRLHWYMPQQLYIGVGWEGSMQQHPTILPHDGQYTHPANNLPIRTVLRRPTEKCMQDGTAFYTGYTTRQSL